MSKYILILTLFFFSCYNTKKTIFTKQELFSDGKVKRNYSIITKSNKEFDLHENYKEEKVTDIGYFHNGKVMYKVKYTYFLGNDFPCRQALYEMCLYDSTGVKRYYVKSECDCHKEIEITYNNHGKILTKLKKEIKRLY